MLDREEAPHKSAPLVQHALPPARRTEENSSRQLQDRQNSSNSKPSTFQPPDSWASYVDSLDDGETNRNRRLHKSQVAIKQRGSLIEKMKMMPETFDDSEKDYEKARIQKQRARKNKALTEKKVTADVYIPSVVSVGQLAQLLDVRLGEPLIPRYFIRSFRWLAALQRKMEQSGMGEETSYDHGASRLSHLSPCYNMSPLQSSPRIMLFFSQKSLEKILLLTMIWRLISILRQFLLTFEGFP